MPATLNDNVTIAEINAAETEQTSAQSAFEAQGQRIANNVSLLPWVVLLILALWFVNRKRK